jgi:hypothetical protein
MDKLYSVDLPQQTITIKTSNSTYFNSFKNISMALYGYPIRVKLYDLKLSKKAFIKLLASNGLIYDYYLMCAMLEGRASSGFNLHYFSHLYRALNIPLTIDTLCSSFIRWNEIKQFKKERRNTNRIKKGLDPIL